VVGSFHRRGVLMLAAWTMAVSRSMAHASDSTRHASIPRRTRRSRVTASLWTKTEAEYTGAGRNGISLLGRKIRFVRCNREVIFPYFR
jgi:hypothetical protein